MNRHLCQNPAPLSKGQLRRVASTVNERTVACLDAGTDLSPELIDPGHIIGDLVERERLPWLDAYIPGPILSG